MKRKTFFPILIIIFIILALGILYANFSYNSTSNQNSSDENKGNHISISPNMPFQLKINQTAFIETANISLTFLNITEDSRCPEDAVCVWPGQVKALFSMKINQQQEIFNLTLNSNETKSQKTMAGYMVKLSKVDPYPKSDKTISTGSYVATLTINRTNM